MRTNLKYAWIASCALLTVTLILGGSGNPPSGTWAPTGALTAVRNGAAAVALPDGRVLVIGGAKANGQAQNTVDVYSGGAFSAGPAMAIARKGHTATLLEDGRVLVAGGTTSGGAATGSVEIFNPASNSWSPADPLNEARSGAAAVSLRDGSVLVAGGSGLSGALSSIEIYDAAADSWSVAGNMSTGRVNAAAATLARWPTQSNQLIDRQVIIVGGSNGSSVLSSTSIYDPATGQVSAGPSLPGPRKNASAVTVLGGYVYVAGGNDGANDLSSAVLIGRDGSVTPAASLLAPRSGHIAVRLPGANTVLIAGGSAGASAEIWVPWTNTQKATGAPAGAHLGGSSASAGQGAYLVAGGSSSSSAEVYGYATADTDKNDYTPGETVAVSGSGWTPGEVVTLVMHEDVNPPFHADIIKLAVADANGNISDNNFYTVEQHDVGIRFFATATGALSGHQARTTFTDAPAADIDQCRTGPASAPSDCNGDFAGIYGDTSNTGWVNGNAGEQNAHYAEGLSIGYRARLSETPQQAIDVFLSYDNKHSDHVAIDFLSHYQCLEPHAGFGHAAETITPTDGSGPLATGHAGEVAPDMTFPIPAPNFSTAPGDAPDADGGLDDCPNGNNMAIWGGAITQIAYDNPASCPGVPATANMMGTYADGVNQSTTFIRVRITPSDTDVVLGWGGHIGSRVDWGFQAPDDPRSAGGISGSPYHMRLESWCFAGTNDDVTNLGNQDRSLSAAAVLTPATKRGRKWNDLNGNGVIDGGEPFLAGWTIKMFVDVNNNDTLDAGDFPQPAGFPLTDVTEDGTGALQLGEYEFKPFQGNYIVCEELQANWTQSFPTGNTACAFDPTLGDAGYAITLANGDTDLDNNFGNFQRVDIVVKKVMIGGTDTFNYTGNPSGSISTNNGTITESVAPGTYMSTEGVVAGWALYDITCDDSNSTGDEATRKATFIVDGDEGTITCTFTNIKPDAQIDLSPLTDVNAVGQEHVITATVQQDDMLTAGAPGGDAVTGFGPAPNGTLVTFSLLNNTAGAVFVGGVNTCLTTGGSCSVTIVANSTGGVDIHATTTFGVLGVSLTRATGTGGLNSADAHKDWVNARILIAADDTNEVGTPHTFTVTVEADTGSGFQPVVGAIVDVDVQPAPDGGLNEADCADGTNASGQCAATINSSVAGVFTATASTTLSINGVQFMISTDGQAPNSGPAIKTYVDASIALTPQTDTNQVSQQHEIKATVLEDPGTGPVPAEGELVTFVISSGDATFVNSVNTCTTNAMGMCSVFINDSTPGNNVIDASVDVGVGGLTLHRATNGNSGPGGSDAAEKLYVNARISITPTATNEVGTPHNFVVTVEQDTGSGFVGVLGAIVDVDVQPAPDGGLNETDCADGTNASGQCTAIINSSVAGVFTANASTTISVNGVQFMLSTNGVAPNSGPAVKTYVEAKIVLSPLEATNNIGTPHTITATVMEDDGGGFDPSPGETVTFSLLNNTANASFVGGVNTCVTDGAGQCSVQINSNTAGSVDIHASVDVHVGGLTLHRETDGTHGSSGDANKIYVAANIIVIKECEPAADPQLFTFSGPGAISGAQLACGGQVDSGPLAPGNYDVGETVPVGWDLTNVTCDDDQGTNPRSNPAALVLEANETITCTFHNVKRGKITVIKQVSFGDVTAVFPFDASGGTDPAYVDFDLDVNPATAGILDMNMQTLKPGNYSAQELISTVQNGTWEIDFINHPNDAISCTADSGSSFTITGAVVNPTDGYQKGDDQINVALGAGGDVTCTFINRSGGKIRIIKACLPDPDDPTNGMFNFTATYVNGDTTPGPLTCDAVDPTNNNAINDTLSLWQPVFDNVNGTIYTVGEVLADLATLAPGFSLTGISCVVEADVGTPGNVGMSVGTPDLVAGDVDVPLRGGQIIACTFTNTLEAGDEGCTPGFWKNHAGLGPQPNAWPAPYSPMDQLDSVFTIPQCVLDVLPEAGTATLWDALNFQGGSGVRGAAQILLRAAVAALLNSASPDVDYPLTTAEVINMVNTALASCNRNTMLTLAAELDEKNNLGCPIGKATTTTILMDGPGPVPAEVPDTTNLTSKPASKPIGAVDNPVGLGLVALPTAAPAAPAEAVEKEVSEITSVKLLGKQVEARGRVVDSSGTPLTGVVGITFALYAERAGGAPVWLETRNIELDEEGRYTVLLTVPTELGSLESHWLGAQVQGQAEQARVALR